MHKTWHLTIDKKDESNRNEMFVDNTPFPDHEIVITVGRVDSVIFPRIKSQSFAPREE